MKEEFVPYEQALALKELGFDESTYTWRQHGNGISGNVEGKRDFYNRKGDVYVALPLYQQAFRWFREKCSIFSSVDVNYCYKIYVNDEFFEESINYNSHEEAELECIKKSIEIVKDGR